MSAARLFTYEEALATLPRVRAITEAAVGQVASVVNAVGSREEGEARKAELDEALGAIFEAWARRVSALGCQVKGPWLVDWDSGSGYYCWQYPEQTIGHFHGYEDGFAGRMPIN